MKVMNIRDFFKAKYSKARPTDDRIEGAYRLARKKGFFLGRDGRAYIPESRRGKGVGYGRHGAQS